MELRENNGADSALRYPETDEAHLVAFGVAGIGAIEIRSVKGAWAGIAFVGAAMRQGCGMSRIHRRLAFAQKTRHDSVAGNRRQPVVRLADPDALSAAHRIAASLVAIVDLQPSAEMRHDGIIIEPRPRHKIGRAHV